MLDQLSVSGLQGYPATMGTWVQRDPSGPLGEQ